MRLTLYIFLSTIALGAIRASAQAPTGFGAASQHSGAVGLFISGKRPEPKTPEQILSVAKATKFYDAGKITREFGKGGQIEYTPREFQPNTVPIALSEGLLVSKFTLTGTSQVETRLKPGTYFVFVDFVEGRWIARTISTAGQLVCVIPGIEVKQVMAFGGPELHKEHSKPTINTHGIGIAGGLPAAAQDWVEYQVEWTPLGAGCFSKIICIPGGGT